jgi:hypothetical protein
MRSGPGGSAAVISLALTLVLRAHPEWELRMGKRAAMAQARRLAPALAREYLLPHAGRAWIISSSTVREFVDEQQMADKAAVPERRRVLKAAA